MSNLTEVRRQKAGWQRTATQALGNAQTAEALAAYRKHGFIVPVEKREYARSALIARWAYEHKQNPDASQLVLAYTRADVSALNADIRTLRQQTGQLGYTEVISTETGKKPFAVNDRVRFGRNERDLAVKNGSLGTVEGIESGVLTIKLDGDAGTRVIDAKFYKHLDYGYATTVHKAQGTTVDRSYVLATNHFDRHTAYVALSRHRDAATVFYASDDFGGRAYNATPESVEARFTETLSRTRPQELVHDYLERETESPDDLTRNLVVAEWEKRRNTPPAPTQAAQPTTNNIDSRQQAAAERWAARHQSGPTPAGQGATPNNTPAPSQKIAENERR